MTLIDAIPVIVLCLALTLTLTGCEAWGFVPVATSTAPALATRSPEPTGTAGTAREMGTIVPTPTPARCIVTTGLEAGTVNVRGGPGMAYQVVDVVTEGQQLPLIGEPVNGWQRVTTPALVDGWFYVIRWCKKGR